MMYHLQLASKMASQDRLEMTFKIDGPQTREQISITYVQERLTIRHTP